MTARLDDMPPDQTEFNGFKIGDYAQAEVNGKYAFDKPMRIRDFVKDANGGDWYALFEGERGGVPVTSLRAAREPNPLEDLAAEFETSGPILPNKADISAHLYTLFGPAFVHAYPDAWIEIAYANAATGALDAAENFSAVDLQAAAEFAERQNKAGCNVYAGVALRHGARSGRASGLNVLTASHAWVEFDKPGDAERINAILEGRNLRPAIIVTTGLTPNPRAHLYFNLADNPAPDKLKAANTALKTLLGSDDVQNPDRVMRLAGTVNYPTKDKRERGYVAELVTLHIRKDAPAYTIDHLIGLAGNEAKPSSRFGFDTKPGRTDDEIVELLKRSRVKGEWHNAIRNAIATMIGRGWSDLQIKLACAPYCEGDYKDVDLVPLIEGARTKWDKPNEDAAAGGPNDAEIERLARLSTLEYERQRKEAAEALGSRTPILDRLVNAARERLGLNGDADGGMQGRAISFPEPEPWPEPVDGAALLNAMAATIRKHVVMSNTSSHVAALWVLHSWLIDCFVISPRLGVRSATKGCGKTLLLDVLGRVVRRPLRTLSITPAATFRIVEGWQPTLLIDEADTFLNDNEGLRGILDGNRKGDAVLRTVGDDFEVRAFATYAAVTIALIGTLPDTLHDRSVVIDLRRRLPKEKIAPFRFDRAGHLDVLARMTARWAQDNAERVAATDPAMPKGVINREADNWRPLAAIAAVARGRWPTRLAKAATAAHAGAIEGDAASTLEMLLADIRDAFATDEVMKVRDMFGAEQIEITSAVLVKALVALDGRPWAEMGKVRKPITQNRLARMLRALKPPIVPQKVGPKDARVSGYVLAHFKDAFERYLSPDGVSQPDNRTQAHEMGTSCISQPDTMETGCPVEKCKKPNNDGVVSGCPVANGDQREERATCAHCGSPGGNEVFFSDGQSGRLHRQCEDPYRRVLDGHGPAGLPADKAPPVSSPSRAAAFRVVGPAQPGSVCVHCFLAEEAGTVLKIASSAPGSKSEPLHEECAARWFAVLDGDE